LPGIDPVEWTLQKKLWGYMRDASGGRWDEIDDELTHFPQKPALRGHAAADLALLKAQCDIRMSQGSLTGFYDLAEAIGGSADWGIADPQFDPYYAYSDFATLNTWDGVGDVLVKLSQDKSSTRIGARRWFELAAPSVLYPFGMLYSDISIEDRNQLRAHYYERAAAFVPDPKVPPPATGGYREILANQLRGEAFIYTGKGQLLLEALKTLPAQVAGIPDSLWNAYKIGWRTLGYGGTLSLGDALDSAQQISEAVELLPDSPFKAHVHALLGVAYLSQNKSAGNLQFAETFSCPVAQPMLADQFLRGLYNKSENVGVREILEILAHDPYLPETRGQMLTARCIFAVREDSKFGRQELKRAMERALRDGANGLHLMETRRDPLQAYWRDELRRPLYKALKLTAGTEVAEKAKQEFDLPVSRNSVLKNYLDAAYRGEKAPPPILAVVSSFEKICAKTSYRNPVALAAYMNGLDQTELQKALQSLPKNYRTACQGLVAKALFEEAARRGLTKETFTGGDWDMLQVRRAELLLGWVETTDESIAMLREIAADEQASVAARNYAGIILDALGPMKTFDAYMWAQDWIIYSTNEFHYNMLNHALLLTLPLASAAEHSEVRQYLQDTRVPVGIRSHHLFNIGQAYLRLNKRAEVLAMLNGMIDTTDYERSADSFSRPIAETWRFGIWWQEAFDTGDQRKIREMQRKIVDYVLERMQTLVADDQHYNAILDWGWNAATALGDLSAVETIRSARRDPVRSRIWKTR
ncbi:hypothetical protein HYR69_08525, partial [Candidatus Sumerlaeota bacterium]|nr:hypothetical protein [Candidatus Sumerlaeota bacterium]